MRRAHWRGPLEEDRHAHPSIEHGPRDFFPNPAASDPRYIAKPAVEGGFNGIAIHIKLAEKISWDFVGEVPLILKLNGKTDIPSKAAARPRSAPLMRLALLVHGRGAPT